MCTTRDLLVFMPADNDNTDTTIVEIRSGTRDYGDAAYDKEQ